MNSFRLYIKKIVILSEKYIHSSVMLSLAAPLLVTWYVFISLYSHNISGITLDYFWLPFLMASIMTIGIVVILVGICGSLVKGSIISSFLLITFFAYGHIDSVFGQGASHNLTQLFTLGIYLLLAAGVIWYVKRGAPFAQNVIKYLAIIATMSIVIALLPVVQIEIDRYRLSNQAITATNIQLSSTDKTLSDAQKPDIYYLIFDKYAGANTLANFYDYDNQPFLNQLRQREFFVAEDSHANYPKTTFSLSSTLNYDYLQNLINAEDPAISDATTAAPLLSNNRVAKTLKQLGYTYYHAGNWYELTDTMDVADINIQPSRADFPRFDSFTDLVLESTYYPLISSIFPSSIQPASPQERHRLWAEFQHQQIKQVTTQDSPKFVVLHMLMPHDPYVYDADCISLKQPIDRWNASPQIYTDQLLCANKIIIDIVDTIFAKSTRPPIIVVQSDEGPEAMVNKMPHHWQFSDANLDDIKERTNILNAYYFPDNNYESLYQSITPVNSFRTIFRQYFNFDLPNLEDRTYVFPDKEHLFNFIDVTNQLR